MARTLADLVDAGGLVYAQSRLTRGDDMSELLSKLQRRYPQYQPALLSSVAELAQAEERAKAEIASASPGQLLGPDVIPLLPGIPSGMYSVDVQFTPVDQSGATGPRRFFRLDFDSIDISVAHLLIAAGELQPVPGRWADLRSLLTSAPAGSTIADLAATSSHAIARAAAAGPAAVAPAVNTGLTKEVIDVIITQLPLDESADIVFPTNWMNYRKLRRIIEQQIKSIVRG